MPSKLSSPSDGKKAIASCISTFPRPALLKIPIGSTKNRMSEGNSFLLRQRFMIVMNFRFLESGRTFLTSSPSHRRKKSFNTFSFEHATTKPSRCALNQTMPSIESFSTETPDSSSSSSAVLPASTNLSRATPNAFSAASFSSPISRMNM